MPCRLWLSRARELRTRGGDGVSNRRKGARVYCTGADERRRRVWRGRVRGPLVAGLRPEFADIYRKRGRGKCDHCGRRQGKREGNAAFMSHSCAFTDALNTLYRDALESETLMRWHAKP